MFTKNDSHLQQNLFGIEKQLPKLKRKKLFKSKEMYFYKEIFCKINEEDFSVLFSSDPSRPNAPVNTLIASCILKEHNGWTIHELLDRIDFDLLTRTALGLSDFAESPFCCATYYNLQYRLFRHFQSTGENLLDRVFDKMTDSQLKKLKIKTDIQRMDSFQALSNIRSYSRIQLLIEMLLRLYRVLSQQEQQRFKDLLAPYLTQSSSKYVYDLKGSDVTHELEKLADAYHALYTSLKATHSDLEVFRIFERVYTEQFTMVSEKIQIKETKDISSGSLQSPDDLDATFRLKNGKKHQGQVVNVCETANPDNALNLITDVVVASNNTDDSTILNERIDEIKNKTPKLNELHTDGAYGSADNDRKMQQHGVNHIQTAVRGRAPAVEMKIEEMAEKGYQVSCPKQQVLAERTKTRLKAVFDVSICAQCPHQDKCQSIVQKNTRVFYFNEEMVMLFRRAHAIKELPIERRRLRPNVEATVKEYTKAFNHKGKLRVRGWYRTMIFAYSMSMAINFGRIYRYAMENLLVDPFSGKIYIADCILCKMINDLKSGIRFLLASVIKCQRTRKAEMKFRFYPALSL